MTKLGARPRVLSFGVLCGLEVVGDLFFEVSEGIEVVLGADVLEEDHLHFEP